MRILWNEIKKILTWKILLLLVLVNSVVFFFRIEFYIEYFPNGSEIYSYNIGVEMVDKYGVEMDEDEIVDFKQVYDAEVKKADHYLQSRKEFVDLGIDSYVKFRDYDPFNSPNQEFDALHDKVMFEEKVKLFWELQERDRLIGFHDRKEEYPDDVNEKQKLRYEELIAAKRYGMYTEIVISNFRYFIEYVAIAVLFSLIVVISPMILRDRSRQMLALQYTSKTGRNLYKTKIIAGLISTFIVITGLLTFYLSIYSLNNTAMFFEVPINMFIGNESWYDPTFFHYILLCVAVIYILGFVFGLLAMSFSSIVPNTMTLIGIQIPFIIGMIIFGMKPLIRYIIAIWNPQWLAPTAYSVMVVVSVLFIIYLWKREKKRDIVL